MEIIGIVIQARMNSSRLPCKVLRNFCGKPMLMFLVDILRQFDFGYRIIIATTTNHLDKVIVNCCIKNNLEYFAGDEINVFKRFYDVAEEFQFKNILRLTADNPLVSYSILKNAITSHIEKKPDLTSTREILFDGSVKRYVPKGLSLDLINSKTLLSIKRGNLNKFEKEHVIPVFFNGNYTVNLVESPINYTEDLSIDTMQDFNRVQDFTKVLIKNGKLYKYLGFEA